MPFLKIAAPTTKNISLMEPVPGFYGQQADGPMRCKLAGSGRCFRLRRKSLYEAVISLLYIAVSNKLSLMAHSLQMNIMKTLLLHTTLSGM